MNNEEKKLWQRYKYNNDEKAKEELITRYLPLAKQIVEKVNPIVPSCVDKEDLVGFAIIGLIEAIERYDIEAGVKFNTFAYTRIKGEMLDNLRRLDWVPRQVRKKMKELDEAYAELEQEYGREPTIKELAKKLKKSEKEINSLVMQAELTDICYLEDTVMNEETSQYDDELSTVDIIKVKETDEPDYRIKLMEEKKLLIEAIEHVLTKEEKEVIALYYYEELSLKEIGKAMNMSESRVSQFHTQALLKLRRYLNKHKLTELLI